MTSSGDNGYDAPEGQYRPAPYGQSQPDQPPGHAPAGPAQPQYSRDPGPTNAVHQSNPYGQSAAAGQSSPYGLSAQTPPPSGQATPQALQSGAVSPYLAPSWPDSPYPTTGQVAPTPSQQWHTYSERVPEPPVPQVWVAPAAAPTNTLSIVTFVTSLLGFGVIPVILGHISLNQLRSSGESGRGLAIAGLVIGYVTVAVYFMFLMLIVVASANF